MNELINGIFVKVPEKYKDEFKRETLRDNFQRLSYISIILVFVESILYLLKDQLLGTGDLILIFLLFNVAMVPVIWHFYKQFNRFENVILYAFQDFYIVSSLAFGVGLTYISQETTDLTHMYFMIVLAAAVFFYTGALHSFMLLFAVFAFFSVFLVYFQSDPQIVFVLRTNSLIVNILAWILSRIIMKMKLSLFLDRKLIEEKNDELAELVKRDSMTMLYNHETALILLEQEINCCGWQRPLSIIIADVDDFKDINDTFGHLTGDHVIKKITKTMGEAARPNDKICRYGGEEFLIIMPDTDLNTAVVWAQSLQKKMINTEFGIGRSPTLSGGICQFHGESMDEFIMKADERLYRAKRSGKDRFVSE